MREYEKQSEIETTILPDLLGCSALVMITKEFSKDVQITCIDR